MNDSRKLFWLNMFLRIKINFFLTYYKYNFFKNKFLSLVL